MNKRAHRAAGQMHEGGQLSRLRPTAGDGALFAMLSGRPAKVMRQKADKEGKRARCVFAPSNPKQAKGAFDCGTIGIIEPGLSPGQGLFMEENREDRSKIDY